MVYTPNPIPGSHLDHVTSLVLSHFPSSIYPSILHFRLISDKLQTPLCFSHAGILKIKWESALEIHDVLNLAQKSPDFRLQMMTQFWSQHRGTAPDLGGVRPPAFLAQQGSRASCRLPTWAGAPPPTLHHLMLTGRWTGFGCSPQARRERRRRFRRLKSWAPGGTQVKEVIKHGHTFLPGCLSSSLSQFFLLNLAVISDLRWSKSHLVLVAVSYHR